MSLLMEALRKAEEAKSKAAQEDQENGINEETLETPVTPVPADLSSDPPTPESSQPPTDTETPQQSISEDAPVASDPEPDDIETPDSLTEGLTLSGSDEESLRDELPASVLSLEPIPEEERTTARASTDSIDPEPPVVDERIDELDNELDDDDDAGLSLLKSSYFSRTRKRGGLGDTDDDLADIDYENPVDSDNQAAQPDLSEAAEATDSVDALLEQEDAEPSREEGRAEADNSSQDATVAVKAKEKEEEQKKRSSAGALFLAKQQSQKQRWRKMLPIAAVLLVIPVAGAMYWFYASYNSAPTMQFNIPAGGLADRGGLGNDGQLGNNQLSQDQLSQDGNSADSANQPEAAGQLDNVTDTTANNTVSAVEVVGQTQPPASPGTGTETSITTATASIGTATAETTPTSQQPETVAVTPSVQPPQQTPVSQAQNNNASGSTSTRQPQGLSFTRTQVVNVVNPDLNAAYDSYQQGDLANASRLYQQALSSEPNNRDALLGLASTYLKQNNIPMSQNLYARLLELNPRDPIARAGLLETSMLDDPGRQESELKSLITAYPGVAPLSFALGNLYATQSRWNEAQNAYFSALLTAKRSNSGGDISPDYAFNLAVSLERLNQLRSALEYYREAEALSRNAIPGFDAGLLNQRLNYLEQQLP